MYSLLTRILTSRPNRGQGKATKLKPTAGYTSAALAELFTPESARRHKRSVTAIVVGSVIGSLALLGVVSTVLYLNRKRIGQYFNGGPEPTPEIGEGKTVMEIMDKETFWELDAQQVRKSSIRNMIIDGVHGSTHGLMLRGGDGGQNQAVELDVNKKSVAELEGGKKESGEKPGALPPVEKSAESIGSKDEKDGRRRSNSNRSGDFKIDVVSVGSKEHTGSMPKDGGFF